MSNLEHLIGRGRHQPMRQLYLVYSSAHQRFMVEVRNFGSVQIAAQGAFATISQMHTRYLMHPLRTMGNQPMHYHLGGAQGLSVKKFNDHKLLFTLTNPPQRERSAQPEPFLVEYDALYKAAHAVRSTLLARA